MPPAPWQNPINAFDVNNDTFVSPIDVLQIINELNERVDRAETGLLPSAQSIDAPPPFLDVNGDGYCAPRDALMVINLLNRDSDVGEGEGTWPLFAASPVPYAQLALQHSMATWSPLPSREARPEPIPSQRFPGFPGSGAAQIALEQRVSSLNADSESSVMEWNLEDDEYVIASLLESVKADFAPNSWGTFHSQVHANEVQ